MNLISINIEELRKICIVALMKKGASKEEAEIVFNDYLDAELRGRTSHGFASFIYLYCLTKLQTIPIITVVSCILVLLSYEP